MNTQFPKTASQPAAIPEIAFFHPAQPLNCRGLTDKIRKGSQPLLKNIPPVHDIVQHRPFPRLHMPLLIVYPMGYKLSTPHKLHK